MDAISETLLSNLRRRRSFSFSLRYGLVLVSLTAGGLPILSAGAQTAGQLVATMAANEVKARNEDMNYVFLSQETSPRTGGHRWTERVVETKDGTLRRLVAVDGKPLSSAEAKTETDRINEIVKNPEEFRRAGSAHRDEEVRAQKLLQLLPKAFTITKTGEVGGCMQFAFRPDPEFRPSTYEERVASAMVGTLSLKEPMNRLCSLDATISHPIEFGFGLLGRIEQGGHFSLERIPIDSDHWKSDRISVHVKGRILLLKSLAREQDVTRTEIHLVSNSLSLAEAAQLSSH